MTEGLQSGALMGDLRTLIEGTRARVAATVNHELVLLYWQVGRRVDTELLAEGRAAYGNKIVVTLSRQLEPAYGRGFNSRNLHRMAQFARLFPTEEKVVTLSRQLSWSHFVALLPIGDVLARDYYAELCRIERWSVRTLRAKIGSMLFERTALSKKPDELIRTELDALGATDRMTPSLVFRDPYILDFLELRDTYSERDLESAILHELEAFILELGSDFTFVARQKRIIIDGEDFYIDLLFFHRGMRRLIAVELKLDRFKPADKGQVELYLRWLDRHERREGEASPLGLILCTGKREEMIELLELEATGIHIAEYWTALPPRALFEARLNAAVQRARDRAELKRLDGDDPIGLDGPEGDAS